MRWDAPPEAPFFRYRPRQREPVLGFSRPAEAWGRDPPGRPAPGSGVAGFTLTPRPIADEALARGAMPLSLRW